MRVMQQRKLGRTGTESCRMIAMKPILFVLLLCVAFCANVQARAKTVLPDACGDDGVKFDVKTEKDQPAPGAPAAGKAQIVFVETEEKNGGVWDFTTRFGLDGAWVGADKGDSYFIVNVDPGVHHVCASAQSMFKILKKSIDAMTFTAEAGKVYYIEGKFTVVVINGASGPGVNSGGGGGSVSFGMSQLDEDMGKYRVKAWKLATWKTK
jgi:hypothetical protein